MKVTLIQELQSVTGRLQSPCSQSVLSSAVLKTPREGLSRERNKLRQSHDILSAFLCTAVVKIFWVLWIAWACEMKGLCARALGKQLRAVAHAVKLWGSNTTELLHIQYDRQILLWKPHRMHLL